MRQTPWKTALIMSSVLAWITVCGTSVPATLTSSTLILRVSVASDGTEGNGEAGPGFSISAGGRYVAFRSDASNLVPGDTNGIDDIFLRVLETPVPVP